MTVSNNIIPLDLYKAMRSFESYLNTEVKVTNGAVERSIREGINVRKYQEIGSTIEVKISNTAPVETSGPMIVFIDVNLRIKYQSDLHRTTFIMANEGNLDIQQTTEVTFKERFPELNAEIVQKINRSENIEEHTHGNVLFPGESIKYKLDLTYHECPDARKLKLWAEGTISSHFLLQRAKAIVITNEAITG